LKLQLQRSVAHIKCILDALPQGTSYSPTGRFVAWVPKLATRLEHAMSS